MKLNLDDSIRLVTGKGMWHTDDCGEKLHSIHMSDGPHGLRKQEEKVLDNNKSKPATCFPAACAVACSWDENVASMLGEALGKEAWNESISVILGPGVNIKRSPLCGRNFEYYSEDPYLTGKMASAYINALQREGIGASLKHLAGNSQETHRQTSNSQIDERALREIYLSAFEEIIKSSEPATVMASYNRLNGEYSCENRKLLTDILRNEWGYKGTVVSDWGACIDLVKSIKAGMDLEMPDSIGIHTKKLKAALKAGIISTHDVESAAGRVASLVERYAVENRLSRRQKDISGSHKIAKEIECRSAVLLTNDGILPLSDSCDVAVIGALAERVRFQGGGSSHINTGQVKNFIDSLKEAGLKVSYASGYILDSDRIDKERVRQAISLAREGKTILYFGGLTDLCEGEGYDRKNMNMPSNQTSLFEEIYAVNKRIVYVSVGGSPYSIPFADKASAILHMYLGGEAVAEACADLITGKCNPSGKLAETFPFSADDTPCSETFATGSDDIEYRESIFVGYRYYDKYNVPVQFPFGYGLSYTTFGYSDLRLSTDSFTGGEMYVSFTVRNTGKVNGSEVSQLYVGNPHCCYLRADKELKGFSKTELAPGNEKTVTLALNERSFSIYDEKRGKFVMPTGKYRILIGSSSKDIQLSAEVSVIGTDYSRDDRAVLSEYFDTDKKLKNITGRQFKALYGQNLSRFDDVKKGNFSIYTSLERLSKNSRLAKCILGISTAAVHLIMHGKQKDDPAVVMMVQGIREGTFDSVVCQSAGLIPSRLEEAAVLSANGHSISALRKIIKG